MFLLVHNCNLVIDFSTPKKILCKSTLLVLLIIEEHQDDNERNPWYISMIQMIWRNIPKGAEMFRKKYGKRMV